MDDILQGDPMTQEEEVGYVGRTGSLPAGTVVAKRYRVIRHLASGGMGEVFLAEQFPLGRTIALKVMHLKLSSDRANRQRFLNEAVAVSKLSHPHTITVYDFGETEEGNLFIAMEYFQGDSLHDILKSGPISIERAVNITRQVARSLSEAHKKGIVHRDLKPENVLLGELEGQKDFVKVVDFGIAKLGDSEAESRITMVGQVCGTPEYMSPEQARGDELDGRSDLYALGVVMYEMLAGRPPFKEATPLATVLKHQSAEVPPLPEAVPWSLREIISVTLQKDRKRRWVDAQAMLDALDDVYPTDPRLCISDRLVPSPSVGSAADVGPTCDQFGEVAGGQSEPLDDNISMMETLEAESVLPNYRQYIATPIEHRSDSLELSSGSIPVAVPVGKSASSRWLHIGAPTFVILLVIGIVTTVIATSINTDEQGDETEDEAQPRTELEPSEAMTGVHSALKAAQSMVSHSSAPQPVAGYVTLASEPSGAYVYFGDELLGTTPILKQELVAGQTRPFRFQLPGYKDYVTEATSIRENDIVEVTATMVPEQVVLMLNSDPAGATIQRDGQVVGVTPGKFVVEHSETPITFTFSYKGYVDKVEQITPNAPEITFEAALEKKSKVKKTAPKETGNATKETEVPPPTEKKDDRQYERW